MIILNHIKKDHCPRCGSPAIACRIGRTVSRSHRYKWVRYNCGCRLFYNALLHQVRMIAECDGESTSDVDVDMQKDATLCNLKSQLGILKDKFNNHAPPISPYVLKAIINSIYESLDQITDYLIEKG